MSGTMLTNPFRFGGGGGANGVNFDGTNDYLTLGADLTGNGDSKLFSGSMWFKRGASAVLSRMYAASGTEVRVYFHAGDSLRIEGRNAGGSTILDARENGFADTTSWHHIMWSFDMADEGASKLYKDGVDAAPNFNTFDDDTIDFTQGGHAIGADTGGSNKFNGCLADVWLAFGQFIDLTSAANRLKFYNAGSPVDLGSDGSTPTGTAPIMFFSGVTSTWHTNDGSGGGFTENGALSDCADSP